MIKKILKYPDTALKTKSIDAVSLEEVSELIQDLWDTSHSTTWGNCVGLAANQIGVCKRVFYANGILYINPEILKYSDRKEEYLEGCYSLEDNKFDYKITRAFKIKVRYKDRNWNEREKELKGFHAQVFLHEYDHLEGKTCAG